MSRRKTFGLALSGGSLRGAAHIGVLKVLEQEGLKPDYIAGTSAGSIVAGLYASGLTLDTIEYKAKSIRKADYLDININPLDIIFSRFCCRNFLKIPSGIIKGNLIEKALDILTNGKGFSNLRIPTAIISVDIKTGEKVVFTSKELVPETKPKNTVYITDRSLAEAMRASISIPGIFVPKKIGNRLLVDGGIKDNVPVEILRRNNVDIVVAVDLKFASQKDEEIDNLIEILIQTTDIMGQEISNLKIELFADMVIDPGIYDVNLTDIHMIPECIRKGVEATQQALPKLKAILLDD